MCTFPTSRRGPPGDDFVELCPWVRNFVAVVAADILPSNWAKDKVKCGTMTDTKGYKLLLKMRQDESEPEEVASGATASSVEQSFFGVNKPVTPKRVAKIRKKIVNPNALAPGTVIELKIPDNVDGCDTELQSTTVVRCLVAETRKANVEPLCVEATYESLAAIVRFIRYHGINDDDLAPREWQKLTAEQRNQSLWTRYGTKRKHSRNNDHAGSDEGEPSEQEVEGFD